MAFKNLIKNLIGNPIKNMVDPAARANFVARNIGSSSILSRVGVVGGYGAAYGSFSALTRSFENQQKSYYGEERYNQYYGSGADLVRGGAFAATAYFGGFALLNRDPITRTISQIKYGSAKLAKRSAISALGKPKELLKEREYGKNLYMMHQRSFYNAEAATYNAALAKRRKAIDRLYDPKIEKLGKSPMLQNPFYLIRTGLLASTFLGYGTSMAENPLVQGAVGLGVLGAGTYAIRKAKGTVPTAITLGAMAATYGSISRIKKSQVAEGTITDMSYASAPSAVSKMNFSTAGLVQALHSANRKY